MSSSTGTAKANDRAGKARAIGTAPNKQETWGALDAAAARI